ncbi:MAG: Crp/Fnr family transcriptional regulator [Acetobacteraceae bacterium]|nr:Crp/Fnr family transcriptional regulator [Pseudomonadota bacterium]
MPLSGIAMFEGMAPEHRALLEPGGIPIEPRDGAVVFHQGEPPDSVYAVTGGDGHVRIGAVDRNSKALMVEVFRAGEIFGEIGVIDGGPRTASAVVEGRVRLYKIRATAFEAALKQSGVLGEAMSRLMARRLRRTFELLQDATFETLEVRLARQVLYLAEREGRQTPDGLRLGHRLRQGDLADLLGATTRSIITILNNWRNSGLVAYDTDQARLTIKQVEALRGLIQSQ